MRLDTAGQAEKHWKDAVRAHFAAILREDGDEQAELDDRDIPTRRSAVSALAAASQAVARLRERRGLVRPPLSRHELRAEDYLRRESGVGGGVDPVGFLIAWAGFQAVAAERLRSRIALLEERLLSVVQHCSARECASAAASAACARAIAETLDTTATGENAGRSGGPPIRPAPICGDGAAGRNADGLILEAVDAESIRLHKEW